jgi:hypothetical protein
MRLISGIMVVLAIAAVPVAARGQATGASGEKPELSEEEKTVQIVLYPAAEARPALKHQLLPPLLDRRPGNAAVWWNRIPAERGQFFESQYAENGPGWKFDKWLQMRIGDPSEKAYREKELGKDLNLLRPGQLYADMDRAARFESCDWQLPIREGNVIAMCLSDVQQTRSFARLLAAKAHLEIAEGKFDQAVRTLQTGYAEARHVAESPTLVSGLVAAAISGLMTDQVRHFIQQPDAPNLYWSISTLPRPLISFRAGAEAESSMLYLQFPELRDLETKKLAPEEWREMLGRVLDNMHSLLSYSSGRASRETLVATTAVLALQNYPTAKRYLIEAGRSAAEVEAMPVSQVILLYTVRVYDELSDEHFKWFLLPGDEVGNGLDRAGKYMSNAVRARREIIPIASLLLPAVSAAKGVETRGEWNLAMLRIFEAMRLYAAAHDGQWPERLADIREVPIPKNPIDDKPFIYQRQGNKAILTCENGPRNVPWRYEIILMQKAK